MRSERFAWAFLFAKYRDAGICMRWVKMIISWNVYNLFLVCLAKSKYNKRASLDRTGTHKLRFFLGKWYEKKEL